jgi:hypothetical protein
MLVFFLLKIIKLVADTFLNRLVRAALMIEVWLQIGCAGVKKGLHFRAANNMIYFS